MAIEEVMQEVMQQFEEQMGIKAKKAWPISISTWQVEDEDGNVWTMQ